MSGLFRITNASGQLITNPGFEVYANGFFDGWSNKNNPTLSQSESNIFAGRYAARIQNGSTTADRGSYQDIAIGLLSGREYTISVEIHVAAGTAVLSVSDGGSFSNEERVSSSGTGAQRLAVTKAATAKGIRIALYAREASSDIYFDDVRIAGTSIDLIDGADTLFHVVNWRQNVARYKNGGVWQESPLDDGRRPVMRQYENYLEQVEFQIEEGASEDATIAALRGLFALMEAAVDFWASDGRGAPVYIEARGRNETKTRYAVVYAAEIPELPDPYSIEWKQLVLMDMTLEVEHGDWLSLPPGEGIYVAITTQGQSARYSRTDIPTQSEDDCTVDLVGETIALANNTIELGNGTVGNAGGFRFRTVDIPPGATILSASITFESGGASTPKVIVLIDGEASVTPAVFSTYADYAARTRTSQYVRWQIEPFSGAGVAYSTPDISQIIQEIIDLPSWAAGNNIAIFIEELESNAAAFRLVRSWNHGTAVEPTLNVTYTYPLGQEVYIANKRNEASITTVVMVDDSTATETPHAIPVTLPLTLFPASPAVDDSVVFMSRTDGPTAATGGPFSSLVFNLSTGASASSDYEILWEYYDGAAWQDLDVQDNTEQLSLTGVHSVHWIQPADWDVVTLGGSTGYAVRARLDSLSGTLTRPVQQTLDIYTVTWPYADIDNDIVGGDRPALARLRVYNESDAPGTGGVPGLWSNRVIVGLRSLSRGRDFTAYLNLSDAQNPAGVTVAIENEAGGTPSFVDLVTKATGRAIDWSPPAASALVARASISLDETLARQYAGTFHIYLRARQLDGNAGDIAVQVRFRAGGNHFSFISEQKTFEYSTDDYLFDFGRAEILAGYQMGDIANRAQFFIYASNSSSDPVQVHFYDLVLIPADEWMGDFTDWDNSYESQLGRPDSEGETRYLDIDGIHVPRRRTTLRHAVSNNIYVNWRQDTPGPPILQANAGQRLWFLTARYINILDNEQLTAPIATSHRVDLHMSQRYKAGRGNS